ncbi:MAG: dihydroorotase [Cyclobacteriaceae bacterium]|jgi:dihydroorotase
MSLLLKNCTTRDTDSSAEQSINAILIQEDKIVSTDYTGNADQEIDLSGKLLVPGLFDLWSDFCDPGQENKEDVLSGLSAARAGGYTDVSVVPDTEPRIDSKGQVVYLKNRSSNVFINLHPIASVYPSGSESQISEMRDLSAAGAVAFSSGKSSISSAELLLKSLQYAASFGGVIFDRPSDHELSKYGHMHEGMVSTTLGLRGIPAIAEIIAVERDLRVLEYAGGRLHLTGISSAGSLDLIAKAKSEGLKVTCDVSINNLIYTDSSVEDYDTNFKLDPPVRSEADRKALIAGLKNGVIDAITSYHYPQDTESKQLEFDLANDGMIGLQTMLPLLLSLSDEVDINLLLDKVSNGPRRILGLQEVSLSSGSEARFTVIDTTQQWVFDASSNKSRAVNSNLYGSLLSGCADAIIVGEQYIKL